MIPLVAVIGIGRHRYWIPLALIWLLLLPIVLLLLPLFGIGCLAGRVNPGRAISVFWQVLCAMNDTNVEINAGDTSFLVRMF